MLYFTVGIGWIVRCAVTDCDILCMRQFAFGIAAILVWVIFVGVYSSRLKAKHRRMLESQTMANVDK